MPTEIERRHLARQPRFGLDAPCELCGFGPVAAAACAASLIARHEPDRVVLTGIAGTFDSAALPVGTAALFDRVQMHGVGGGGASMLGGAVGFQQWPADGQGNAIGDELRLASPVPPAAGALLTCTVASASPDEARLRLARVPGAAAEDMEGFAVALGCRLAGVPVAVARGISNEVGDREHDRWKIPEALDAAWPIVADLIGRPSWETAS